MPTDAIGANLGLCHRNFLMLRERRVSSLVTRGKSACPVVTTARSAPPVHPASYASTSRGRSLRARARPRRRCGSNSQGELLERQRTSDELRKPRATWTAVAAWAMRGARTHGFALRLRCSRRKSTFPALACTFESLDGESARKPERFRNGAQSSCSESHTPKARSAESGVRSPSAPPSCITMHPFMFSAFSPGKASAGLAGTPLRPEAGRSF
jgi:hypothetical protein